MSSATTQTVTSTSSGSGGSDGSGTDGNKLDTGSTTTTDDSDKKEDNVDNKDSDKDGKEDGGAESSQKDDEDEGIKDKDDGDKKQVTESNKDSSDQSKATPESTKNATSTPKAGVTGKSSGNIGTVIKNSQLLTPKNKEQAWHLTCFVMITAKSGNLSNAERDKCFTAGYNLEHSDKRAFTPTGGERAYVEEMVKLEHKLCDNLQKMGLLVSVDLGQCKTIVDALRNDDHGSKVDKVAPIDLALALVVPPKIPQPVQQTSTPQYTGRPASNPYAKAKLPSTYPVARTRTTVTPTTPTPAKTYSVPRTVAVGKREASSVPTTQITRSTPTAVIPSSNSSRNNAIPTTNPPATAVRPNPTANARSPTTPTTSSAAQSAAATSAALKGYAVVLEQYLEEIYTSPTNKSADWKTESDAENLSKAMQHLLDRSGSRSRKSGLTGGLIAIQTYRKVQKAKLTPTQRTMKTIGDVKSYTSAGKQVAQLVQAINHELNPKKKAGSSRNNTVSPTENFADQSKNQRKNTSLTNDAAERYKKATAGAGGGKPGDKKGGKDEKSKSDLTKFSFVDRSQDLKNIEVPKPKGGNGGQKFVGGNPSVLDAGVDANGRPKQPKTPEVPKATDNLQVGGTAVPTDAFKAKEPLLTLSGGIPLVYDAPTESAQLYNTYGDFSSSGDSGGGGGFDIGKVAGAFDDLTNDDDCVFFCSDSSSEVFSADDPDGFELNDDFKLW